MRADRLLRLIALLQRHRRLTAEELAGLLEVDQRTVLRDMQALSAAGVPVYTQPGRGGGCVLLDTFTTDASGLTAMEAQALFAWASDARADELGLGTELSGALAKIAASADPGSVDRAEALGATLVSDRRRWFADPEETPALPQLRDAVAAGRRLRIRYARPGRAAPGWRTIDPWGLVDHSARWYLVAAHRGRPRTYRVSRIAELVVTDEQLRTPLDRPLADVWSELRRAFESTMPDPVTIEVAVDPGVEREFLTIARGQFTQLTHRPDSAGRHAWRMTVRARRSALALAMAWAPEVTVLSPPELIEEMQQAARRVLAMYGGR